MIIYHNALIPIPLMYLLTVLAVRFPVMLFGFLSIVCKKKLPFDLSSHKLRHNFATNYCVDNLRKNGNSCVYDLSILMGHESMETTKKYEHFAHELLAVEDNHSHLDKVFQV